MVFKYIQPAIKYDTLPWERPEVWLVKVGGLEKLQLVTCEVVELIAVA